jgi:23S rRNA (adenine2503-C2)-methyltransferase
MTPAALAARVPAITLAEARKAIAMVHRGEEVAPSSALRATAARAIAQAAGAQPRLREVARLASAIDPFVKLVLATGDDQRIEAVRIPLEREGRFTACVSSQVGCALACAFCATGRLGLTRNLETWEIVEQVALLRATLPTGPHLEGVPRGVRGGSRIHGVVFQGMGEPMANLDRVLEAIEVFSEPCAFGIDARNITVCTAGLPHGIRRLAQAAPRVRLGLSLGSARPEVRRGLMPIDRAHPLADALDAAAAHATTTGLAPMFAMTLLAGVNDGDADADALAGLVLDFAARTGITPRLSILAYNAIGERDPYARTAPAREAAFRDRLRDAGVFSHRRYSGGSDVAAACGQLAARAPG